MLTTNEITTIKEKMIATKNEDALALLLTIEQMQKESYDYKQTVLRKLTSLEKDMEKLAAENERQIMEKSSAYVERDTCVSVLVKLAMKQGFVAGLSGNRVVLELANGQVSWDFEDSEMHLFEELPPYAKPIEEIDLMENYRRLMNAGIL